MGSVWMDDLRMPCFPPLWGQVRTDVLSIGGGMTGLLCARMLQNAGVDCAVAEAASIAGGITKNTTAKITSQHGLIYQQLAKRFGTEKAALYLQANEQALAAFRTLCAGIDCDFSEEDNYIYSTDNREKLEQEIREFIRKSGGQMDNLSLIYEEIHKKHSTFDIKDYGYSRLSSFLKSIRSLSVNGNTVRIREKK